VTPDFFPVLGVPPAIGRVFAATEGARGRDNVVVLSDHLWRTRFGAERGILGKNITLDGTRRMVIGVMPTSFDYPARTDLWIPLEVTTSAHEVRTRAVVGRLKSQITPEQAAAAWASYATHLVLFPGSSRKELIASLVPLKQVVVGDARRPLLIFAGAVAFVLLIACANVANLLLMRVTSRDREIAIRAAIGAGRARLIRQLLTETFAISALGAIAGVALAFGGVRMLLALAPNETIPRAENVHLDSTVLLFSIGLTVVTTLLCGLIPALHATEARLRASLAEGARTLTTGHGRVRAALVVTEVALAVVLLTGAGLMLRSFAHMRSVDLGFRPANVLTTTADLPPNLYRSPGEMHDFHARVLGDLRRIPGVESAAAVNWVPLGRGLIAGDFHIEGGATGTPGRWADKIIVSPDYFRAMGIKVETGREFTRLDRTDAPGVVILSHSIADRFWPRGDAVGKRITMVDKPGRDDWLTIVGVVSDVVQTGVTAKPDAAIYRPIAQTNFPFFLSHITFVARLTGDARAISPAMARVMRTADKRLPVQSVVSMSDLIGSTVLTPRFQSRMLLIFSALALALAVIGIYAVLAYGVAQRQHEIGVRIALGAVPRQVMTMFLRRTMALVMPGLLIGVLSSVALTRVLSTFLFQIEPTDPATFASVVWLLALIALAAASVPARRASRVDPLVALRRD
jgi:putative ABC transport system permease protein